MSESALVNELELVSWRLSFVAAEFANKDPSLSADLLYLSGQFNQLSLALDDAFVVWKQYQENGPVQPIDSQKQEQIEAYLTAIANLTPGKVGAVLGITLQAALDFIDWTGTNLLGINKDVVYTGNNMSDIVLGANLDANYSLGGGNDVYVGRSFDEQSIVFGQGGNDTLIGGSQSDVLHGNADNDYIYLSIAGGDARGEEGNDFIFGDVSADFIYGGIGVDSLFGSAGDDQISSGTTFAATTDVTSDGVIGGGGDDEIYGSNGANAVFGDGASQFSGILNWFPALASLNSTAESSGYVDHSAGGEDNIFLGGGGDLASGGDESDVIEGGAGDDYLLGDDGADTLSGGADSDVLLGGQGADELNGDAGYDIAAYWFSDEGVRIDLTTPSSGTGDAQGDTFLSIEEIQASFFNDNVIGSSGTMLQRISADDGDDFVSGGDNSIDIFGGSGNDTLIGGSSVIDGPEQEIFALEDGKRDELHGETGNDLFRIGVAPLSPETGQNQNATWNPGGRNSHYPDDKFENELDITKWSNLDVVSDYEAGSDNIKLDFEVTYDGVTFRYSEDLDGMKGYSSPYPEHWEFQEDYNTIRVFDNGLAAKQEGGDSYFMLFSRVPEVGIYYTPVFVMEDVDIWSFAGV